MISIASILGETIFKRFSASEKAQESYYDSLKNLCKDLETFERACEKLKDDSKSMPSISEIKKLYFDIFNSLPRKKEEVVCKKCSDSGFIRMVKDDYISNATCSCSRGLNTYNRHNIKNVEQAEKDGWKKVVDIELNI